jgi:hypothetical protein
VIHFVVPRDSEFGIQDYLQVHGLALAPRMAVHHYEDLPARSSLPAGVYVFSGLDQLLPTGRRFAIGLADQLGAAGVPVLNHPGRTLRRYDLLEELFRRGLNRHRAVRAGADLSDLRYPVFLREENHHTGALTPLLATPKMLRAELGRALVRGLPTDDLLVMEFCETADPSGTYRKYAAFIVGTEVIPRSLAQGRKWALKHSGSVFTRETADEERSYVEGNPHEAKLRGIFETARVEYGRIDYALRDGEIETWEINLNPTIGRGSRSHTVLSPEVRAYRAVARDHFYRRFQAAFEGIDPPGGSASIPISFRPAALEGLDPMARPAEPPRRLESVKWFLRPFRPVLDPIVRAMLPLLARVTSRRPPSQDP